MVVIMKLRLRTRDKYSRFMMRNVLFIFKKIVQVKVRSFIFYIFIQNPFSDGHFEEFY